MNRYCRANRSTVRFKALLKITARLQAWELKDGNMPSLILLKRDRKRESSFFLFAVITQKPIRKNKQEGQTSKEKKAKPFRTPKVPRAYGSMVVRYLIKQEKGRKLSRR